jgi:hypothetical protein
LIGVVILDKHDYDKKMDEILSDTSKFELSNAVAIKITIKHENQVKALLKKLMAKIASTKERRLYPSDTPIGILYGLPNLNSMLC